MIELECPNCARMGSVPNDKANSRMVCKKCHMVFHMTPTGRTILGEPPAPGKERDKKHASDPGHTAGSAAAAKERDWAEGLFEISRTKLLGGVLTLGLLGIGTFYVFAGGGKDVLTMKAQQVADAVAAGNLSSVKGLARSDGAEATAKWYDVVRSKFEDLKKSSAGGNVLASVFVIEENHAAREGQVVLFFAPAAGSTREKSIASAAGSAGEPSVTQVLTFWKLDRGYWRLDGTKTSQVAPTSAPASMTARR